MRQPVSQYDGHVTFASDQLTDILKRRQMTSCQTMYNNNNNNNNKWIFIQDNPSVQSTVINGVLLRYGHTVLEDHQKRTKYESRCNTCSNFSLAVIQLRSVDSRMTCVQHNDGKNIKWSLFLAQIKFPVRCMEDRECLYFSVHSFILGLEIPEMCWPFAFNFILVCWSFFHLTSSLEFSFVVSYRLPRLSQENSFITFNKWTEHPPLNR